MVRFFFFLLITACMHLSAQAALVSYEITGYVDPAAPKGAGGPIFNTSTDVPGSGGSANWITAAANDFVDFTVGDVDQPILGTVAHLRVTLTQLSSGVDVMLAQTSNSQGLTDGGTLSLLLSDTGSAGSPTATIQLDWFTPNGLFDTPLPNRYTITSFDIDFEQFNEIRTADLDTIFLSDTLGSTPSNLTESVSGAFTRVSDLGGTSSSFSDAENAAVFRTPTSSSQVIGVGKNTSTGAQLYMYEFTDPPENVNLPTPEPSAAFLVGFGGLTLLLRRRRR